MLLGSEMVLLMEALAAELMKCARNTAKFWSSYDPKSQQSLSLECQY